MNAEDRSDNAVPVRGRDHEFTELGGAEKAGCKVNPAIYQFPYSQGTLQTGVVVYRDLSEDFFTDPSEQLFWAQDMVTMLKGFVEEGLAASQPVVWFPEATFRG